jgi:hypothetical protein
MKVFVRGGLITEEVKERMIRKELEKEQRNVQPKP